MNGKLLIGILTIAGLSYSAGKKKGAKKAAIVTRAEIERNLQKKAETAKKVAEEFKRISEELEKSNEVTIKVTRNSN